jgi:integrase
LWRKARRRAGDGLTASVVHYHAVIRLDLPGEDYLPPPGYFSTDLLRDAIGLAAAAVTLPVHPGPDTGTPLLRLRFGARVDIKPIRPADDLPGTGRELSVQAVGNYIAKYATKTLGTPGLLDRPITTRLDLDTLKCAAHYRRMVVAGWELGAGRLTPGLHSTPLCRWAHQLGHGGHFLTKLPLLGDVRSPAPRPRGPPPRPPLPARPARPVGTPARRSRRPHHPHLDLRRIPAHLSGAARRRSRTAPRWSVRLALDRINLAEAMITVNQQVVIVGRRPALAASKTSSSLRDVPMPRFLHDAVIAHAERFAIDQGGELFRTPRGGASAPWLLQPRDLEASYRRGRAALRTTFHDSRHTFASTALAGGVPISEVSRWLGHKSITTTVDLYGHLVPEASGRARDALDRAFGPDHTSQWLQMCPECALPTTALDGSAGSADWAAGELACRPGSVIGGFLTCADAAIGLWPADTSTGCYRTFAMASGCHVRQMCAS